ncbi:MAG: NfeD family protein [Cytophagales bacterium]|nr:NfeD family protein [Cytophagales bacterium]
MQIYLGKVGKAHTILRPSGKVLIEDEIYDAFTRGDFVEQGDSIEVIGTEGVNTES